MNEQNTTRSKKDLILTIVGLALCAIFAFILVCNMIIIIKGWVDPNNPPSIFGATPLIVETGSMSGSEDGHLEPGDLIFIESVAYEDLEVGDVVTYKTMVQNKEQYTTHRIIEWDSEYVYELNDETIEGAWITKGDANPDPDFLRLEQQRLVGRVVGRVPLIGTVLLWLKEPYIMVLCVAVPLGLIILIDFLRKKKIEKAAKEAKADKTTELEDKAAALEAELARLRALAGEEAAAPTAEKVDSQATNADSDT